MSEVAEAERITREIHAVAAKLLQNRPKIVVRGIETVV